jgi:hypothetical protein
MSERLALGLGDRALAEHSREQGARLRIMAALLPGAELKANLRAAARMYEDFEASLAADGRLGPSSRIYSLSEVITAQIP